MHIQLPHSRDEEYHSRPDNQQQGLHLITPHLIQGVVGGFDLAANKRKRHWHDRPGGLGTPWSWLQCS